MINKINVVMDGEEIKKIVATVDGETREIDYSKPEDAEIIVRFLEQNGIEIENGVAEAIDKGLLSISSFVPNVSQKNNQVVNDLQQKAAEQLKVQRENPYSNRPVVMSPEKLHASDDQNSELNIDGKKVKVKTTKKIAKILGVTSLIAGVSVAASYLGSYLSSRLFGSTQTPTQTPKPNENNTQQKKIEEVINNYSFLMDVPEKTQTFLKQSRVIDFLSQYKNQEQLKEVISALCYGYESNILTDENGNFRMTEDGDTYLHFFTKDFLCAKAVVNDYTPEEMLALFGSGDVTYEQIMDGFHSYCSTVSVYGMNATEVLPFRYLTNGDVKATSALNNLFQKLSTVNRNRKAGILNSSHTDDFIAAVHEMFVQNDQSLNLTEGTKTVAMALVDSFCYMQSFIDNGEPLYLHEDRGLAKAGINLADVDGHLALGYQDQTAYEFTSLYEVADYGYGPSNGTVNSRCYTARERLNENLEAMYELANASSTQTITSFANLLYQNGLTEYGNKVSNGDTSESLLQQIEKANPVLTDEIQKFESKLAAARESYVSFETTVQGVDNLLGIKGLNNNFATLMNIRMNDAYINGRFQNLSGNRYTISQEEELENLYNGNNGNNNNHDNDNLAPPPIPTVPPTTVTVTTTNEPVNPEDLTPEEQQQVSDQIQQNEEENSEHNQAQLEAAQQVAQQIVDGIQNGTITTPEQAQALADQVGMTLEPGLLQMLQELYSQNPEAEQQIQTQIDQDNQDAQEQADQSHQDEQEDMNDDWGGLGALTGVSSEGNPSSSDPTVDTSQPESPTTSTSTPTEAPTEAPTESTSPTPTTPSNPSDDYYWATNPNEDDEEEYIPPEKSFSLTENEESSYTEGLGTIEALKAMRDYLNETVDADDLGLDTLEEEQGYGYRR